MADVSVTLLASVLHAGIVHDAGAELEVDEAVAESLVERGLAESEKPRRGRHQSSSSP